MDSLSRHGRQAFRISKTAGLKSPVVFCEIKWHIDKLLLYLLTECVLGYVNNGMIDSQK